MNRIDIEACIQFSKEGVTRCEDMVREMFFAGCPALGNSFAGAEQGHRYNIKLLELLKKKIEALDALEKQFRGESFFQKIIVRFRLSALKNEIAALENKIIAGLPEAARVFVHPVSKAA